MQFSNIRELKSKTSEVLRNVAGGRPVIVTSHGKPKAVLLGIEADDDLDDLLLAYDPVLRKKIEEGLEDIRSGKVIPLGSYLTKRPKHLKR